MIELVTDPNGIPFCSLAGLRVCTAGRVFEDLGVRKFRGLLRNAGANVATRLAASHDLIVIGDEPSLAAKITIVRLSARPRKPVVAAHRAFVDRFYDSLRDVEVGKGVTFEQHLQGIGASVPMS